MYAQTFKNILRVNPRTTEGIFITQPTGADREHRDLIAKMMFETFKVPKVFFGLKPVMDMFGAGRTSGTVVDLGGQMTSIAPIHEGFVVPKAS